MDIPALQAFVTVAETNSFSMAAEQLFLTQPAVSKRIGTLETELGVALFDRIGRQITLTEAGRALLPRARRILIEVEDSRRALSSLSDRVEGRLSMGTSHHLGLHRLPPILKAFHRDYPQVDLDLHFLDSEQACQAVVRGDLELAVVTLPPVAPAQLAVQPVWDDPLVIVTAPDHPLAQQAELDLAMLAPHPAVLPAHGTYTRQIVEEAFSNTGLEPTITLATNYLETIKMLVAVGLGWSTLPETMVDSSIVSHRLKGFALRRSLGVVTHTARSLSNAARAMLRLLQDEAEKGHARKEEDA